MKVFISWSGERSKRVALIFRDWLPTVIQAIEPFVSSEDIEKGSRWNTDIAKELRETTFGLICVTKDNLSAPWLNFEAGALSKTIDNSFVAPILFDVKPSDLKGSPLSQFQATCLTEDDMKRLVETLNSAAGNCLTSARLVKAFSLCYSDLEKSIEELRSDNGSYAEDSSTSPEAHDDSIFEEVLETVRNTQRLLGNTDAKLHDEIEELQKSTAGIIERIEKNNRTEMYRFARKPKPEMVAEVLYKLDRICDAGVFPYNILIVLSFYKDDFPWLYEAGSETVNIINSNAKVAQKRAAIEKLKGMLEYAFFDSTMREIIGPRKDLMFLLRTLPDKLSAEVDQFPLK